MVFKVVLDVFSGRANPAWSLDGVLADELADRLRRLAPAPKEKRPNPPDLGYRGLRLTQRVRGNNAESCYEVYGGIVKHRDWLYLDESRSIERWLLTSGGVDVEQALRKQILREMRH
jgi:hypothetical protein